MRVVAFDLSLRRTGYATPEKSGVITTELDGMRRLQLIRSRVLELVHGEFAAAPLVVIEGYAFSSHAAYSHELGALGGVVRLALFEAGFKVVEIGPTSLKRYATGRGNAGKEEVLASAIRRLNYGGHDNNVADALWLRTMALDRYGIIDSPVPASHREAFAKIEWPVLKVQPQPAQLGAL